MKHERTFKGLLIFAAIILSICACLAVSSPNHVEFRLVVSQSETAGRHFDAVRNGSGDIYILKMPYLADRDIEQIDLLRSLSKRGRLLIGFVFNENGKKRLYRLIKKFGKRKAAIFAEGKIITTSSMLPPALLGQRIVVAWPGSEAELMRLAGAVNRKPPGVFELYVEEQGKYNDIAADAWAEAYRNINMYFEAKCRQFVSERAIIEEGREQE